MKLSITDIPELPPREKIHEIITNLRDLSGLGQGELAVLFEVDQSTISRWFDPRSDLRYEQIRYIISGLIGSITGIPADKTIKSVATYDLKTAKMTDTLYDAVQKLQSGEFTQLPVISEGRYVGMLTDHSIMRYLLSEKPRNHRSIKKQRGTLVSDLQTFYEEPSPIREDTLVVAVAHLLGQDYALPVKEDLNEVNIVAIVTRLDMLKLIRPSGKSGDQ